MKILCVADERDPLVYSSRIKERFGDIEFVLGAGDLSVDYYEYILTCLNKPLYFVFGNHQLKLMNAFKNGRFDDGAGYGSQHIGGKVKKVQGKTLVAGLGGAKRYNKGENQYSEWAMLWRITRLIPRLLWNRLRYGRYLDILLTHAPPYGIGDCEDPCHRGFKVFLWFMKKFKPRYLVHGHVHLYDINAPRRFVFEKTMILNCYNHAVVEL